MQRRILPHPLLSALLAVVWVLLVNEVSVGSVVLGAAVGIAVAKLTSVYWPGGTRMGHPLLVIEYLAIVLYDIVLSNIQVAYLVLFRRGESLQSRFIRIPLDLHSPEAIATLAGTITLTPGTVTADVTPDGRALLVHCLQVLDDEAQVNEIKGRYERRLRRIFE
jgi:multicomponent K+:H+ antiporter subunit E